MQKERSALEVCPHFCFPSREAHYSALLREEGFAEQGGRWSWIVASVCWVGQAQKRKVVVWLLGAET